MMPPEKMVEIGEVMASAFTSASEVRVRLAEYGARRDRLLKEYRVTVDNMVRELAKMVALRRKSKGWRKHVRRMKAVGRV